MWTGSLQLWEALGGSLGKLIILLMFCGVIWAWWRDIQRREKESKEFWAREKEESKEFWARMKAESDEYRARMKEESDEFWGKIDREREESKERDDRDHARLSSAIAALREDVRVLHGDVRVLLDRSDRPAGDEAGGGQSSRPYQVARQATPDQCEDDAKSSSDEPVAQTPVDSAAEDPAD